MAGNYEVKLARLIREGKIQPPDGFSHLTVLHEDSCAVVRGQDCDCDPDFEVGMPADFMKTKEEK